jgi:hypothetical protein
MHWAPLKIIKLLELKFVKLLKFVGARLTLYLSFTVQCKYGETTPNQSVAMAAYTSRDYNSKKKFRDTPSSGFRF